MHGDRGNVQLASKRALVQRLNVFQSMLETVPAQVDFILGHRVKHERVIRVGGMTQGEKFSVVSDHRLKGSQVLNAQRPTLHAQFTQLKVGCWTFPSKNKTAAAISRDGCLKLSINVR
jgi:hypothetical protein